MQALEVLIVGGGIGGLTAAIALTGHGHAVTVIERDPEWSVYGVGIIQQGNVLRAMKQLGLLDDYLSSSGSAGARCTRCSAIVRSRRGRRSGSG